MTVIAEIIQSQFFAKQKKKLHKNQIKDLDNAVKTIFENPAIGNKKIGDLQGVRIYKFKSSNMQILLAGEIVDNTLYLYAFASHQNFYKELKKYIHH